MAAVTTALVTNAIMYSLGFEIVGSTFPPAHPGDLPGNALHLGRMVALLGGANYALPGGYPREPLRILLALVVFAGVAAVLVSAVRHIARRSDPVVRAFACYWDAQNLTWQSGMRLLVAPVSRCGPSLCGYNFATIRSWYDERRGPTFLIVDPTTGFITKPPPVVRDAAASYRFGPLSVYVFSYDLARYIRPPQPD